MSAENFSISLKLGLSMLTLLCLVSCNNDDSVDNNDTDAPVISININNGDTGIPRDITIVISASESLHHANGVAIANDALESLILFEDADAESVPYEASIDVTGERITIDPVDLLNPAERYSLSFETVHDVHGNATSAVTISFTIESYDFNVITGKWTVLTEEFSSFDESGMLLNEHSNVEFLTNRYTVEFEGTDNAGAFRQMEFEKVEWITGDYQTNPSDTTVSIDVNNGRGNRPEIMQIEIVSANDQVAELVITEDVTIDTEVITEVRRLELRKNGPEIPVIDLDAFEGEWSVTSLFEEEFVESSLNPGEFLFRADYTLMTLPNDRFTLTFSEGPNLWFIDTYYTNTWEVSSFNLFDDSNIFYNYGNTGEKLIHLSSMASDDDLGFVIFSYDLDDDGRNLMYRREYHLERNEGTGLEITVDDMVGSWLVVEFREWENGVDVTDPDDEDSPLGSTTIFNSDMTAQSIDGTRVTDLIYRLVDGNSLAIEVQDEVVQNQLFHIKDQVVGPPERLTLAAGFVREHEDCVVDCERILFEFELVVERQ